MAHYTNNDQKNLEELLEEGWFDRLKARGSQAVGTVKGIGQMAKGIGQGAYGAATGNAEMQKQSRQNFQTGMSSGSNAKLDSYIKSIDVKITKMVEDVVNDMNKLGIDIPPQRQNLISGAFNGLKSNLVRSLEALKQNHEEPSDDTEEPVEDEPSPTPPPLPKSSPPPPPSPKAKKVAKKTGSRPSPTKGKTSKDPLARHLAPEQEERLF
jgi:hypothetical protein